VFPLLINCRNDDEELISSSVPHAIQENGTVLTDLDGVWAMKGRQSKSYSVEKMVKLFL